ncbi:aspartate kinase [Tannerella sp. oral taxon BU063 isolate Cell 8/11]|jgi:aspartate kinase|uniref:Aspartokinase n=1 Tax=Tannerella sp. oral taxon BU063 isolate Cell 8/11 TaxID=1411915 RepID=W2CVQ4_9BACT|nr:aspartate kinase [Tannerella sp. oral taxon BU063 isolate Cell 8/11]
MNVLKFGGTSVGSAERIKNVARLITTGDEPRIVVLSAMAGTTNALVEIADYLYKKNPDGANEVINRLSLKYAEAINDLYATPEYRQRAEESVTAHFDLIRSLIKDMFTSFEERIILARGELMSTEMMHLYLAEQGIASTPLSALDFMRTDKNAEPDAFFIKENLLNLLDQYPDEKLFITEGYICRNAYGEIDNLQRGGSDYTASLIGAAVRASEVQIWTDIDGMHNNDPRIVEGTTPVHRLNFDEAAELAYFGAKILHPTCILPAKQSNIPVRLLNTMQPDAPGTLISNETDRGTIKAVAAKDNITAIWIKSGRMLLATGFMRKVFETFENHRTPVDMVTTSEVGISVTIDNPKHLEEIVDDLKRYGTVTVDRDLVIVCVVGDLSWQHLGLEVRIISALRDIPVRMISYGGSNYNLSLLIPAADKARALQALSRHLFDAPEATAEQ